MPFSTIPGGGLLEKACQAGGIDLFELVKGLGGASVAAAIAFIVALVKMYSARRKAHRLQAELTNVSSVLWERRAIDNRVRRFRRASQLTRSASLTEVRDDDDGNNNNNNNGNNPPHRTSSRKDGAATMFVSFDNSAEPLVKVQTRV